MNLLALAVGRSRFLSLLVRLIYDGFCINSAVVFTVEAGSVHNTQCLNTLVINQAVFLQAVLKLPELLWCQRVDIKLNSDSAHHHSSVIDGL